MSLHSGFTFIRDQQLMILVRQAFPQNQRAKTVLYNSLLDVCRIA